LPCQQIKYHKKFQYHKFDCMYNHDNLHSVPLILRIFINDHTFTLLYIEAYQGYRYPSDVAVVTTQSTPGKQE